MTPPTGWAMGKEYGAGMVEQPAFTITGADGGGSKRLSWRRTS